MERLLLSLRFTGKVSVVMQNGQVLKSGYEEAYFSQRANLPAPTGRLFAAVLARIVL